MPTDVGLPPGSWQFDRFLTGGMMIYDIPHGRNRGTLLRTNPHEV